jgi:hypothetical protein
MNFIRNQALTKNYNIKTSQTQETLRLVFNVCQEFNTSMNTFVYEYQNYVDDDIKQLLYTYQNKITTLINNIDIENLSREVFKNILNELIALELFLKQNKLDYNDKIKLIQTSLQNLNTQLKELKQQYDINKINLDNKLIKEQEINNRELDRISRKHNEYMKHNNNTLQEYQKEHIILSNRKIELEQELDAINYENSQYKEIAKIHRANILEQISVNKKQKKHALEYKESAKKKLIGINEEINILEPFLQDYKEHRYNISIDYYSGLLEIATILQYLLSKLKEDLEQKNTIRDTIRDTIITNITQWFTNTEYTNVMSIIIPEISFPFTLECITNDTIEIIKNNLNSFINNVNDKLNNDRIGTIKNNLDTLKQVYGSNIQQYLQYISDKLEMYANDYLNKELAILSKKRKRQELKLYKLKRQQQKLNNIINRKVNTAVPIKDNFLIDKRNELSEITKIRKSLTTELNSVNDKLLKLNTKIETLSRLIYENDYTTDLSYDLLKSNTRLYKMTDRIKTSVTQLEENYKNTTENLKLEINQCHQELSNLQKLEVGYNTNFISRLNNVITSIQKYC